MDEMLQILKEIGLPFAYDHFEEGQAPDPPFLCYLSPSSHNFGADGIVYLPVLSFDLELYTEEKDPQAEAQIETVLTAHGLFFDKTETAIPSERLFEVLYSFELKGDSYA